MKMPANDMFTATALLRTMADVGPNHPTTRSFSAANWRGGDASLASHIFRSQYYEKLVAWGGDAAVRHDLKYDEPCFDIVSFDPRATERRDGQEWNSEVCTWGESSEFKQT